MEPEEPFTSMQQLGKHVPATTNTHATAEELLGKVFSLPYVPKLVNA
jgi:hypothetical protein